MSDIKIMLVDDHAIVRAGLRTVIASIDGMKVVAEAADGLQAIERCRKMRPDFIIMDITMPKMDGIESTREILAEFPEVKVLALSMHSKAHFVNNILQAGASGYLLKDCVMEELPQAINEILNGETFICSKLSELVANGKLKQLSPENTSIAELSPREQDVVKLLADGLKTREIATKLFISPRTVEMHRAQIMKKLKVKSIAEIVKYAIKKGFTNLD